MLETRALAMNYGQKSLFEDVNLNLQSNERYGVVGANGSGKSTFLRILSGHEVASHGHVHILKGLSVGFLQQDHYLYENDLIIEIVMQGNTQLWDALKEKDRLQKKINLTHQEGYRLGELEEIIMHEGGYTAEIVAERLLVGLGIEQKYMYEPLKTLSGGYKLRVLLAKLLFQNPDIMLLDEPTNHLDLVSISWLEDFLINEFKGLLLFISHDRGFLNNLATYILDVDYETITEYVGDYDDFVELKDQILQQKKQEISQKKKKVETMQQYVDRFRASTRSAQAQSRLKMIGRIEVPEMKNSSVNKPYFHFTFEKRSGMDVLQVEKITKNFEEKAILKNISLNVYRGDKCAIIGANGIGKSTLLKILLQELMPDQGSFHWSDTVSIGYFAQNYRTAMNEAVSIWDWIEQSVSASTQEIRNVLGQVLFSGSAVNKKIPNLSGGECARLVLAKLILEKNNVLLLDEPTNHLDLESIGALAEALQKYTGTVLCVSHNRYFIDKFSTRVIALTEHDGVRDYAGNYHHYLEKYGKDYLAKPFSS